MAFEPRLYRNIMNHERFRFFNIIHKETDLWIGVSHSDYTIKFTEFCEKQLNYYRSILERYIIEYPEFQQSMNPLHIKTKDSQIIDLMFSASANANVGPMAAVAGAMCEIIGQNIMTRYSPHELIIENGGDIFVNVADELLVQFYAGKNTNFRNLALSIPGNTNYLGICTSSGMFGHSVSHGKADSVTVVCKSPALADAWATSLCNKINTKEDIEFIISKAKKCMGILSVIAVKDDKIGVFGQYPLKMIS